MALKGKGFFIWKVRDCENGDAVAIANLAKQANLSHVLIKIANGTYNYNYDTKLNVDLVPPVAQTLRSRGIQVWGWHYVYGDDPLGEANKAIQRIQQTSLDGYVIDAEAEYKQDGKAAAARIFMTQLRSAFPSLPIALSSYRFPSYHPKIPWAAFLEKCDYNMPQVYWQGNHNPVDQLNRSMAEFQALVPFRPIIPTGSAYKSGSWAATGPDVQQFLQAAQALNLNAANFWEWSNCRLYIPDAWDACRDYPWSTTPPPLDLTSQYINALNTHDAAQVANLYTPTAVHVNTTRTITGVTAIRSWYQSLFGLLPNAKFILSSYTGTGSTRNLTWTAASSGGNVSNGNDTFALLGGKIAYHFTSFTISKLSN